MSALKNSNSKRDHQDSRNFRNKLSDDELGVYKRSGAGTLRQNIF